MTGASRGLFAGRFELGRLLGVGGTAAVYDALDTEQDGARVALKIMHEHLATEEAAAVEFLARAELARTFSAPGLVPVLASGRTEAGEVSQPWMVMELVDGELAIERIVRTGRLAPAEALDVLTGLLAGLGALHEAGLVHRDVSPANIMLVAGEANAGAVRIIDFGLIAVSGQPALPPGSAEAEAPTFVGSVDYVSPEQGLGEPLTPASDLYQAGAVLYFLLTGSPPYPRKTVHAALEAHVTAPPPMPSVHRPDLPAGLDRLVAHAMAKTLRYRFASAAEMAQAVLEVAEDLRGARPGAAHPPTRPGPGTTTVAVRTAVTQVLALAQRPGPAPVAAAAFAEAGAIAGGSRRVRDRSTLVFVIVLILLLAASATLAAIAGPGTPEAVPSESPAPPAVVEEPPPVRPVAMTTVPQLGATVAEATAALDAAGLRAEVSSAPSRESEGVLLSVEPAPGATIPRGSAVALVVASGENLVPDVIGMQLAAAVSALHEAGFEAATSQTWSASVAVGYPVGTEPGAGGTARLGARVALLISRGPEPTPTPAPTPTDTPTPEPTDPPDPIEGAAS